MRLLSFSIFLLLCYYSTAQSSYEQFKAKFRLLEGDTIRLSTIDFYDSIYSEMGENYVHWNGIEISSTDWRNIGLSSNRRTCALVKLQISTSIWAFCSAFYTEEAIQMTVYDESRSTIIYQREIAHNILMETTYHSILKSWLMDVNGDGDKDLVSWKELTDFELPNEFSDNSSAVEKGIYLFENGSFNYEYWDAEKLSKLRFN